MLIKKMSRILPSDLLLKILVHLPLFKLQKLKLSKQHIYTLLRYKNITDLANPTNLSAPDLYTKYCTYLGEPGREQHLFVEWWIGALYAIQINDIELCRYYLLRANFKSSYPYTLLYQTAIENDNIDIMQLLNAYTKKKLNCEVILDLYQLYYAPKILARYHGNFYLQPTLLQQVATSRCYWEQGHDYHHAVNSLDPSLTEAEIRIIMTIKFACMTLEPILLYFITKKYTFPKTTYPSYVYYFISNRIINNAKQMLQILPRICLPDPDLNAYLNCCRILAGENITADTITDLDKLNNVVVCRLINSVANIQAFEKLSSHIKPTEMLRVPALASAHIYSVPFAMVLGGKTLYSLWLTKNMGLGHNFNLPINESEKHWSQGWLDRVTNPEELIRVKHFLFAEPSSLHLYREMRQLKEILIEDKLYKKLRKKAKYMHKVLTEL